MPKIYELLGYPIDDNSLSVVESRKRAYCPFISDMCDGGGNRFMSDIDLREHDELKEMTSSTSGGNKKKRSCIPQAFEDCMLGKPHLAPGINYRQVWARMASQLIVKSQAAMAWNGKTIWALQDLLADYISSSTALDLHKFIAEHTDEVNILAFSYGDNYKHTHIVNDIDFCLLDPKNLTIQMFLRLL